jgi:protein O-mannosyl-transferase
MRPDITPRDRRGERRMALALAAVTLAIFWRATACGFINCDDPDYVTENRHVQQGLTADSVRWAFTARYESLWMPLTWLSHILDWQMYRDNPAGHHLTNVLLHTANTVLLFLLIRRMTGSLWRSGLVAALFALHPLHVETVAWVSDRKGALSMLFWLLTLHAYTAYAQFSLHGLQTRAIRCYVAALLWFAAGLMAKPIVVTLPCVLLLLDYWPLERWKPSPANPEKRHSSVWPRLAREKLPFFLLAGIGCALTASHQPTSLFTMSQRVGNALVSYPRYLWKTFWPAALAMPYPYPRAWSWPIGLVILAAVFLVIITVWVIRRAGQRPWLFTGWFWFLGTLVPVLGLVRMGLYSMADRYTYIPLIGIFLMAAWAAGDAATKGSLGKTATGALAVLVLGLCAWRAHGQVGFWTDSGTLFTHAAEVTDGNFYAHANLNIYYARKGRPEEAMKHAEEAIKIWPQGGHIILLNSGGTPAHNPPPP